MREYAVVYEKTATGWSVYCPDLPGLASCGSTFEEAQTMIREGLEFHIEGMLEDGDAIPDATTRVGLVQTDIVETWQDRFAESA